LTGGLARALEADASQRQVRVEKLADDYTAGRYQVDSMAVSKAMVAEMRASVS
jgi:anti-sigma28 factor (negative regulator of flagellin synthesis)